MVKDDDGEAERDRLEAEIDASYDRSRDVLKREEEIRWLLIERLAALRSREPPETLEAENERLRLLITIAEQEADRS